MICCDEIPTFYRHARFLLRLQILPRQLPHLPVNSVSVTTLAKKIMYHPWNLGGLNPSFSKFGGLSPPSPYVEPPLMDTNTGGSPGYQSQSQ